MNGLSSTPGYTLFYTDGVGLLYSTLGVLATTYLCTVKGYFGGHFEGGPCFGKKGEVGGALFSLPLWCNIRVPPPFLLFTQERDRSIDES